MRPDDLDLVIVETAPDGATAQMVASILEDAGIPALVIGEALVDQWAISQKAMGLLGVDVRVPRARCDEARRLLLEIQAAADAGGWDTPREEPVSALEAPGTRQETTVVSPEKVVGGAPGPSLSRRELAFEVGVVFLFAILPGYLASIADLLWPNAYVHDQYRLWALVMDLGVVGVLLYLMARSGEGWARFGLVRPRWVADPVVALGALLLSAPLVSMLRIPYSGARPEPFPEGLVQLSCFLFGHCVSAFTQELLMRGYLIPRLERLLGSTAKSLALSAALFSLWHVYQGPGGVVSSLIGGLILGGFFCSLRRLWPLVLAHALWNLVIVVR